jgi:hypothetical protein
MWGGKDMDSEHDTFGRPSWVSHIPGDPHLRIQSFRKDPIFLYNYFVTGEDGKPFPIQSKLEELSVLTSKSVNNSNLK